MKPKLMWRVSSYFFASHMVLRKDMSVALIGLRHLCVSSYVLG